MQRREQFLQGLLELHQLREPAVRRAAWRGSLAFVARACAEDAPSPLEALAPGPLATSIRVALTVGLVDDLDWLSAASAAAALYEIAAALPPGSEKRELGRRVLARLYEGDAATFVALATRMALGSGKGLRGDAIRARISLACALPPALGVRADPLALALLSRRELAREWINTMASGSLPDRRLAGQLLEQAARAIARRVTQGDEAALRLMRGSAVAKTFAQLLADREPLVWRHVAVAQGLLMMVQRPLGDPLQSGFDEKLSPTEWRRAATSLAASAAAQPEVAVRKVREVLSKGLLRRDPGAATAFLWGVPAAAEVEPEAAEEILQAVLEEAPIEAAEALPGVLVWGPGGDFGQRSAELLRSVLGRATTGSSAFAEKDDGALALHSQLVIELSPPYLREPLLVETMADALRIFATQGAKTAFQKGLLALASAKESVDTLEALEETHAEAKGQAITRRTAFMVLRELDTGLLETNLLRDLLVLGGRAAESQQAIALLDELYGRVATWVIDRESTPLVRDATVTHPTLRLRRLRTLLHLADTGALEEGDETPIAQAARARCLRIAALLLQHLVSGTPAVLHRTVCAALARTVDALIRTGTCDPADVLLVVAGRGLAIDDIATLAEASMNPDLGPLMTAYETLLRALRAFEEDPAPVSDPVDESLPPFSMFAGIRMIDLEGLAGRLRQHGVVALAGFAHSMEADASARMETLRTVLLRLVRLLTQILSASCLAEIAGVDRADAPPLVALEATVDALGQLARGARQRFGEPMAEQLTGASSVRALSAAVDKAVEAGSTEELASAAMAACEELALVLPPVFASIISDGVRHLLTLSITMPQQQAAASLRLPEEPEPPLPAWLPARRTLGGFYVLRALGGGSGGTVFVARRIEEKNDPHAERLALKVPDYDSNAARSLSEREFMQLFREEASALLGLPHHPNLARFVTFDLGARPKPILVMELVEGGSLERVIASGNLDIPRVFRFLEGVLSGLQAMHSVGVAHLDVKPSNVILRNGEEPVLVDFGLSGRHIRPGCATGAYGAPEVWGVLAEGTVPHAPSVDIYSFGCVMYEMLTGRTLFDASSEIALIAAHVAHDGWPSSIINLMHEPPLQPLAKVLASTLRRDPRNRILLPALRARLRELASSLTDTAWPLSVTAD